MKNSTTDASERLKVARDLHDTISQEIAALGYACDEAIALSAIGDARESLVAIRGRLSLVTLMLRDELGALRSSNTSFSEQLDHLCIELQSLHPISIQNEASTELPIEGAFALDLYRVVREILLNIIAHANAHRITINSYQTDSELVVSINDDGEVNDSFNGGEEKSFHFGIATLHERIASIDGAITYSRTDEVNTYHISAPI